MKAYSSKLPKDYPIAIKPMGEIAGYPFGRECSISMG